MKRMTLSILLLCAFCAASSATENAATDKKDNVKTGIGIGPLPKVGYDADNGFNLGLQLAINNYKDGSLYPNPFNTTYIEAGWYQKGIINVILSHENRTLIPGARVCGAIQFCDDHFYNFYGLNGYQSNLASNASAEAYKATGNFYGTRHTFVNAKVDFVGKIAKNFSWEAGYHLVWTRYGDPGTEKKPAEGMYDGMFLYKMYNKWGIIPDTELYGGWNSELRGGVVYDTRDSEASPTKGIWAEGHLIAAPKLLGTSAPYYKFCLNWRHYIPIYKDRLTFAYRLVYQGLFNSDAPWYIMPYYTVAGTGFDRDGVGGFRTLRGISLCRIQGQQTFFFNLEPRWRFWDFRLWKQNISLCVSGFFEGGAVVKPYDIGYGSHCTATASPAEQALYAQYIDTSSPDKLHLSAGGGLRVIFNRNFIIAVEWGKALHCTDSRWEAQNGNKLQDAGSKASFYFNTGFTF